MATTMTTAMNLRRMVNAEIEHGQVNDGVRKSLGAPPHEHLYTVHAFQRAAEYALAHGEN